MSGGAPKVRIERMTPEGHGLGSIDRKVVFVPYAVPGDGLSVSIERSHTDYALARILKVEHPGPGRIEPRCKHHFRATPDGAKYIPACGGCVWQQMDADTQAVSKREIVRDCLFRIAKLREPRVDDTLMSPDRWRYRNKILVPFARAQNGEVHAGFFAHGSHDVVPFEDCPVSPELSVRLTRAVRSFAQRARWRIYDRGRDTGWLRHLYVRVSRDHRALVTLVTRSAAFPDRKRFLGEILGGFPEVTGIFQNIQPKKTTVVLGPRWIKLWGAEYLVERLGRLKLRVSPPSFMQINTSACELLYGVVEEFLTAGGFRPELALDLYSGIGSIALWIAPRAKQVIGLESNRRAVRDAEANARLNGIRNVRFHAGEVEKQARFLLGRLEESATTRAAAILDPPRAGCSKEVLKILRAPALRRLVYVSCNPATFARDADWLRRHRWKLTRVRPVDLFPQTSHVETAALFERARRE